MANLTEGLLPWQPMKLYFMTDAFDDWGPYWHDPETKSPYRKSIVDGTGPVYDTTTISPSRHKSYAELTAEHQAFYLTQEGRHRSEGAQVGKFTDFAYHAHLIFGKSLVGGAVTGDVFEGVSPQPIAFARVHGYRSSAGEWPLVRNRRSMAILCNVLEGTRPGPSRSVDSRSRSTPEAGGKLALDFLACNHTAQSAEIKVVLDDALGMDHAAAIHELSHDAGECYPILEQLTAPPAAQLHWEQLSWAATAGSQPVGSVSYGYSWARMAGCRNKSGFSRVGQYGPGRG